MHAHTWSFVNHPPEVGWPDCAKTADERSMLVKELHLLKTALFNQAVVDGEIPLRKGVIRLVDEAIYKKVPLVGFRLKIMIFLPLLYDIALLYCVTRELQDGFMRPFVSRSCDRIHFSGDKM